MRAPGRWEESNQRERKEAESEISARVHAPTFRGSRDVSRRWRKVNCSSGRDNTRRQESRRPGLPWPQAVRPSRSRNESGTRELRRDKPSSVNCELLFLKQSIRQHALAAE